MRELQDGDLARAAALLGRGMRDNPINVRAFGPEPTHREEALSRFFVPVLRAARERGCLILGAVRGENLVGVYVAARPGRCQPTLTQKLGVLPAVLRTNPLSTSLRVARWTGDWSRRDPRGAHWHLGPVAVDSHLRGHGMGGEMLADFCARMDEEAATSYLETDKPENVRFYERFGFAVVAEAAVLGVQNWFMSRPPHGGPATRVRTS